MSEPTERSRRADRDRTQVIPNPDRQDVFDFMERLFFGTEDKPEKLELRQAFGPGCRKYGDTIVFQKEFKANADKPKKEQLVALSNEFVQIAQSNCNEIGKAHKYAILARHTAKSAAPYGAWIIAMVPTQPAHYDPNEAGDDEEHNGDAKRRDSFLDHALEHIKQSDAAEQWRQEQFSTAMGHLLQRCESIMVGQNARIEFLEKRNIEMLTIVEQSLDKKVDRDIKYENHRFKHDGMREAGRVIASLLPVAVNRLTAKQTLPTDGNSVESAALSAFLDSLNEEQKVKLFGPITNGQTNLGGGILTVDQAVIICNIADKSLPPETLEQLLAGGVYELKSEQLTALQAALAMEQILPLMDVLTQMQNRKAAREQQPAQVEQQNGANA